MKKLFLILVFISAACGAFAQKMKEADVPAEVKASYKSLYPGNKAEAWEMKEGQYMASAGPDLSVWFSPDGKFTATQRTVTIASLPAPISEYVIENYPGTKIDKAYSVTSADGRMSYKAEVGEASLSFDHRGNFVKAGMKNEEEKDKM